VAFCNLGAQSRGPFPSYCCRAEEKQAQQEAMEELATALI
jgi:hypothetical protein